jgi:hypothetical protein
VLALVDILIPLNDASSIIPALRGRPNEDAISVEMRGGAIGIHVAHLHAQQALTLDLPQVAKVR